MPWIKTYIKHATMVNTMGRALEKANTLKNKGYKGVEVKTIKDQILVIFDLPSYTLKRTEM